MFSLPENSNVMQLSFFFVENYRGITAISEWFSCCYLVLSQNNFPWHATPNFVGQCSRLVKSCGAEEKEKESVTEISYLLSFCKLSHQLSKYSVLTRHLMI